MNFLAHLLLSDGFGPVMVGNFMGDFIKGKQVEEYDPEIQKGIWLHREIDQYTDQHPTVLRTKQRLRPRFRHYSPVVSDVFYDHFLANAWEQYGDGSLASFADQAYGALRDHRQVLPERAQFVLPYMIRNNWLVGYKEIEGIRRALTGMARRASFVSGMEHAHQALLADYEDFEEEFHEFFPQLVSHCQSFLAGYSGPGTAK